MATKEKDTNKELEVEEIVSKSEQFIENNSKKIIYGIIAVALVVGAVLGIKHGYLVPQEKKAFAKFPASVLPYWSMIASKPS